MREIREVVKGVGGPFVVIPIGTDYIVHNMSGISKTTLPVFTWSMILCIMIPRARGMTAIILNAFGGQAFRILGRCGA